jgi:hypothetical protein
VLDDSNYTCDDGKYTCVHTYGIRVTTATTDTQDTNYSKYPNK